MKRETFFLEHQIARFGAMSIQQMQFACTGRCKRATIYRIIKNLRNRKLIARLDHSEGSQYLFAPTQRLYAEIYGEIHKRNTGVHSANLLHAASVAQVFLTLSRYSFVTGIATEHEIDPEDLSKFCHSRIPDGIIQITNQDQSYELAIEVESNQKSESRIKVLLEKYKQTFMRGMICRGLIVVTKNQALLEAYQAKVDKLPSDIEKQILIVTLEGLSSLNSKYFGAFQPHPHNILEKTATLSKGRFEFYPMISNAHFLKRPSAPTYLEGQSVSTV